MQKVFGPVRAYCTAVNSKEMDFHIKRSQTEKLSASNILLKIIKVIEPKSPE